LAQLIEAAQRQFEQQRGLVGEVLVGGGMADACPARHLTQRELPALVLAQHR